MERRIQPPRKCKKVRDDEWIIDGFHASEYEQWVVDHENKMRRRREDFLLKEMALEEKYSNKFYCTDIILYLLLFSLVTFCLLLVLGLILELCRCMINIFSQI